MYIIKEMSLELVTVYNLTKNKSRKSKFHKGENGAEEEEVVDTQGATIALVIYFIILALALMRVGRCSHSDNRIFHYLFALVSPTLYLFISFFPGTCG